MSLSGPDTAAICRSLLDCPEFESEPLERLVGGVKVVAADRALAEHFASEEERTGAR